MRQWREPAALRRSALYAAALGILWAILAWTRPEVTFHLAPVLVAGTLPAVYGWGADQPAPLEAVLVLAAVGEAGTILLAGGLWAAGKLAGPSLLPMGGAILESVLAASVGALGGFAAGGWRSLRGARR